MRFSIGVIAINFADFLRSIDCLKEALRQESKSNKKDLLTRLVLAEAYAGVHDDQNADQMLDEIENEALKMIHKKIDAEAAKKHLSRGRLIRANLIIKRQATAWESQAREVLQGILTDNPGYYYGTFTFAQTFKSDTQEAQKAYSKAYEPLSKSGELKMDGEVRSIILQHMVAAICAFNGPGDREECGRLLGFARGLLGKLPRTNQQECTVFSPLSKANETSEVIKKHIDKIQQGIILDV